MGGLETTGSLDNRLQHKTRSHRGGGDVCAPKRQCNKRMWQEFEPNVSTFLPYFYDTAIDVQSHYRIVHYFASFIVALCI